MLRDTVETNCKILDVQRHIIQRNIEKGLLHNFDTKMVEMKYLYSSHGILGCYETMKYFGYTYEDELGNTYYKDEAYDFGRKIFKIIHAVKDAFLADKDYHMNLEAIPGETMAARFQHADEMLYPENYRYLSDLLSYVAIGARSVENQKHRLTASGLDIPVGMKNPTAGDISVMMNSITAGQHSHTFIYRGWEVESLGNPLTHAILRGYVNKHGQSMPNYHYEDLIHLAEIYEASGLENPAVIIDTNHANSGKKWYEQPRIAKEVLHSCRHSADVKKIVKGLMIESYIEDGAQKPEEGIYGKSITDPCLGWKKTEKLIYDLADVL